MSDLKTFFSDKRTHIVCGFACAAIAIFLTLSFVSFFFTWQFDQDKLLNKTSWEVFRSAQLEIQNWGGKMGAIMSKKFIHDWFGISSSLFVFMFAIVGLQLLGIHQRFVRKKILISCVSILVFSLVLGYFFNDAWDGNIGGQLGYTFGYKFLVDTLGMIPAGCVVIVILAAYLLFTYKNSLQFFHNVLTVDGDTAAEGVIKPQNTPVQYEPTARNANFSETLSTFSSYPSNKEQPKNANAKPEVVSRREYKLAHGADEHNEEEGEFEIEEVEETQEFEKNEEPETSEYVVEQPQHDDFTIDIAVVDEETEENPREDATTTAIAKRNDLKIEEELSFTITDTRTESEEEEVFTPEPEFEIEGFAVTNTRENSDEVDEEFVGELQDYDPTLDLSYYQLPTIDLLENHQSASNEVTPQELSENKTRIEETLKNYGIGIKSISATIGPTITLYEIIPADGVRISKIKNLEDDIALSLAALGIRIIAPIPGKGTIGIEVPNKHPEIVSMRSIIASRTFQDAKMDLPVALGKTISNETYVFDLAKMPHLLVAGATGQGKSVGLNAIMTSLLYKKHPAQLKFVLVDPKKVELTLYQNIEKHFLAKLPDEEEAIITDTQKVVATLNSLCIEMDTRYDLLKNAKLRNIKEYNERFIQRRLNPEHGHKYMPFIVVVIDEFADLIMTAGKEVELPLARLAQLARAIGIHLIIATQRPAANIITGAIKANFPARMAFKVASGIDSRTILDSTGANQLIGKGDMLITKGSELVRVQCAFVDTPEIEKITTFISEQQSYGMAFPLPEYKSPENNGGGNMSENAYDDDSLDPMFEDAARTIVNNQQGSTSLLQRKLKLGYNRAGRIMDQLEAAGVVGQFEGSKARQVLISDEQSLERLLEALRETGKL
ncbi:MAG: DNA translocase FtsK [Bacteroidales bacterium]|jgi:S-DNA-T family DNA segregation ATPase FtsK/SpoIIIE|nr:DNA translocase FtsK [Bacteroidales bacterium]